MKYLIETYYQPDGRGGGWVRCTPSAIGARWFVWSIARSVVNDRLNGRDFKSRADALAAIEDAKRRSA